VVSDVDAHESREVGEKAAQFAIWHDQDGSITIQRTGNYSVDYRLVALEEVAAKTKRMPNEFLNAAGNDVVEERLLPYLRPLVGTLPPIGDAALFAYDPFSNSLIVHGISPGSGTNATWLLVDAIGNAPTWINSIPEGTPGSPPEGVPVTASAYDVVNKKFILTRYKIDAGGNLVPEVWILSNANQQ
jgi:hypothetical protein